MLMPMRVILSALTVFSLIVVDNPCKGANLTTNIDGEACQGDTWILTCTGFNNNIQRWTIETENGDIIHSISYTLREEPRITPIGQYTFQLVSATLILFKSIVMTNAMSNTVIKCSDTMSEEIVTIRITEAPSSPQALRSNILESVTNYSIVKVTWEPPSNDSIDFYDYHLVDCLNEVLYQDNTTSTTIVLSGILHNVNISFVLFANNCGGKSPPVTFILNIDQIDQFQTRSNSLWLTKPISESTISSHNYYTETDVNNTLVTTTRAQHMSNTLLISISILSVIIIWFLILIIVRLIVTLKYKLNTQKYPAASQNIYAELEPGFVHETLGENGEHEQDFPGTYERISIGQSDATYAPRILSALLNLETELESTIAS